MAKNILADKILIIDFGSQYTQLIARRVRELYVYSIILPPDTSIDKILSLNPGALILSGGPSSIYDQNAPDFDQKILDIDLPILGICYGLHLLTHYSGGKVSSTGTGEYGFANINIFETENPSVTLINLESAGDLCLTTGGSAAEWGADDCDFLGNQREVELDECGFNAIAIAWDGAAGRVGRAWRSIGGAAASRGE